ncbi:head completion/stabilization protein [Pseudomonas sp. SA3-5]|uniref:Head completion/stabilization protein n=1 Tax=Pseudomonas aestuarii TaxID=3018340 RepID=A0ABT4XE64_9PSED|nr:head completion/stabilization protein [Pseudomonas aestuarii]MDA7086496.1 head completion/stabilization protein [Pseudomonas aestuarii]
MSGFIANGSIPAAAEPHPISNDGWWPDLDGEAVRAALRLDSSISSMRLEVALVNAVLSVNRELETYQLAQQALGYAGLADVPGPLIQGVSRPVHLYLRAVYCTAGAELAERYRSYDSTNTGNANAEELTPSIDEYRRDARWAMSDLLGKRRTTVELI